MASSAVDRATWASEEEEKSEDDGGGGGHNSKDDDIELQALAEGRRRERRGSAASASSSCSSLSSASASGGRRWPYSAAEERAVVRTFDRRLVLFVAMLYMLSFLDRSNIGNARVAGMDADLQTTPARADWYEWALTAFYATYVGFEWLALLWRAVPAHAFVAALVGGWGLAAALQAVVGSYPWLVALRALLGVGEAGFAGIPLYLARFYRRDELALRTAAFVAAAPLATTFAAALAWAILAAGRAAACPVAAWRLLFLVEGAPSLFAAAAAWRVLPDAPHTARYLTRRQQALARRRLEEGEEEDGGEDDGDDDDRALGVLADPAAWITAAMFFLANMAYSSLPVFLPTILAAMGHGAAAAQALAAPPYVVAFGLVLATAHASDRAGARAPLLVAHALASAAGYGVLSVGERPWLRRTSALRYLAVFPAAAGFFSVVVLLIAWNLNNHPRRAAARQGGAFALFQAVGQCGPLVGTRLYPDADAPLFLRGMRAMAAAMLAVAVLALVLRALLQRRNRRREGGDGGGDGAAALVGRRRRRTFRYML